MSFTNIAKNTTTWSSGAAFLLKEDTFYLLLENGFKIVLDQSLGNKFLTNFTNIVKI
jgi:hypothetical protein